MKTLPITLILATLLSCQEKTAISSVDPVNWSKRKVAYPLPDSLEIGSTYLSIYSQIYYESENRVNNLTVTVSMRNTSPSDSLYIESARYYNTSGTLIRSYFNQPIYVAPMETVEIVINQTDKEGGTGANFYFDWKILPGGNQPLFEAVMISTYGQQGLSFTTQGRRVR